MNPLDLAWQNLQMYLKVLDGPGTPDDPLKVEALRRLPVAVAKLHGAIDARAMSYGQVPIL